MKIKYFMLIPTVFALTGAVSGLAAVINFNAYGIKPNSGHDATPAWNQLLTELDRHTEPVTIKFSPGRYDFYAKTASEREYYISNHTQSRRKKCAILLENRKNITLDGNGAEFIFHGTVIPVAIVNSQNCILKNFSIDYEYPPDHQVKITAADKKQNTVTVEFCGNEPYRIDNNQELVFTAEDKAPI